MWCASVVRLLTVLRRLNSLCLRHPGENWRFKVALAALALHHTSVYISESEFLMVACRQHCGQAFAKEFQHFTENLQVNSEVPSVEMLDS